MSQTITISVRATESGLEKQLQPYFDKGWHVLSKRRGSWWGKMGNTYNWSVILEKEDEKRPAVAPTNLSSITDELTKLSKLTESGAITNEEYEQLKKRLLSS